MEAASKDLETKLTQLQITREKTDAVLASRNENRIKRHRDALCSVVASVEKAKRKLEELKIAAGEELSAITSWGAKLDQDIAAVDLDMDGISSFLNNFDQEQIEKARNDQLAFEKELFEKKLQYTKELKSANLSDQAGSQNGKQSAASAKLPKLTITKFNGTNLDWNRFWGQFTEGIDKSEMAAISKFSYLKEFVDPKVRKCIDGLPFTAEGYEKAKAILIKRYGNVSEVVKAYVKDILDLPTINGYQPRKFHHFYERLLYDVQSLETMGKLSVVNGNVALTIDTLSGIRGDLVRNDEDWQNWDFLKLCDALKSWTRRNPVGSDEPRSFKRDRSPSRNYQTKQQDAKPRGCVYCEDNSHKSSECTSVVSCDERNKFLAENKLCFNCACPKHRLLSVQARRDAIYAPGSTTPPSVLINNLRKTACCLLSMLRRWFTLL